MANDSDDINTDGMVPLTTEMLQKTHRDFNNSIQTVEDLVRFIQELHADYLQNGNEWENSSLERFLEAMAAWLDDSSGYYENLKLPFPTQPDWAFVAHLLSAARIYE